MERLNQVWLCIWCVDIGENAIMRARSGCLVTGIDIVQDAISNAKAKALELDIDVISW